MVVLAKLNLGFERWKIFR